jgi:hypothetical protein
MVQSRKNLKKWAYPTKPFYSGHSNKGAMTFSKKTFGLTTPSVFGSIATLSMTNKIRYSA